MKKLLIPFILLFIFVNSDLFAQRKKGNKTIGTYIGSASINPGGTSKYDYPATPANNSDYKNKSFGIGVGPTMGFFITDNVVVGARVDLYFSTSKSETPEKTSGSVTQSNNSKSNSFSVGLSPFARFFFGDSKSTFWPYAEIQAGISTGPYKSDYTSRYKTALPATSYTYTGTTKSSGSPYFSGGAKLGAVKMFSPNLGLDFSAGVTYNRSKATYKSDYKYVYDAVTPTISNTSEYIYTSTSYPINVNVGIFMVFGSKK